MGSKLNWEIPKVTKLSIRETQNINGDDSDGDGEGPGGWWMIDAKGGPSQLAIRAPDMTLVLDFLRSISASPESLEDAIFHPEDAVKSAGLSSKGQVKLIKRILTHLGS